MMASKNGNQEQSEASKNNLSCESEYQYSEDMEIIHNLAHMPSLRPKILKNKSHQPKVLRKTKISRAPTQTLF